MLSFRSKISTSNSRQNNSSVRVFFVCVVLFIRTLDLLETIFDCRMAEMNANLNRKVGKVAAFKRQRWPEREQEMREEEKKRRRTHLEKMH